MVKKQPSTLCRAIISFKQLDVSDFVKAGKTPHFGAMMMKPQAVFETSQKQKDANNNVISQLASSIMAADHNSGLESRERAMSSQFGFQQKRTFKQQDKEQSFQQLLMSKYRETSRGNSNQNNLSNAD